MECVDYTGKLNGHHAYIQVLKQLENSCIYIEYVLVNEEDTAFLERFDNNIVSERYQNKWWGTKSGGKSKVVRLRASKDMFAYLRRFETFCKYEGSDMGDLVTETAFGINDIAFFDNQQMPMLFTTTHEGYICVRKDVVRALASSEKIAR